MPIINYTWLDGVSGDWGTAANWSPSGVPDGKSNATIAGSSTETVTASANEAVNILTLDDAIPTGGQRRVSAKGILIMQQA